MSDGISLAELAQMVGAITANTLTISTRRSYQLPDSEEHITYTVVTRAGATTEMVADTEMHYTHAAKCLHNNTAPAEAFAMGREYPVNKEHSEARVLIFGDVRYKGVTFSINVCNEYTTAKQICTMIALQYRQLTEAAADGIKPNGPRPTASVQPAQPKPATQPEQPTTKPAPALTSENDQGTPFIENYIDAKKSGILAEFNGQVVALSIRQIVKTFKSVNGQPQPEYQLHSGSDSRIDQYACSYVDPTRVKHEATGSLLAGVQEKAVGNWRGVFYVNVRQSTKDPSKTTVYLNLVKLEVVQ